MRWVPVAIATQVPLPKIDADGVQCGLPGALGSGGCKQDPRLRGSVAREFWSLFLAVCQAPLPKCLWPVKSPHYRGLSLFQMPAPF